MRSTVALSITLPHKMAAYVRKKVKSGEYASESEVIREGLRDFKLREDAYENWLRSEVLASSKEVEANPRSTVPASKVMGILRARHKARVKSRKNSA
jgi:putative addiction module CopG family antidote